MSEESVGTAQECVSIVLREYLSANPGLVRSLTEVLKDEGIITLEQKKAIYNILKDGDVNQALEKTIELVSASDDVLQALVPVLQNEALSDAFDQRIAKVIEVLLKPGTDSSLSWIVLSWSEILSHEAEVRKIINEIWPGGLQFPENDPLQWPFHLLHFCITDGKQQDVAEFTRRARDAIESKKFEHPDEVVGSPEPTVQRGVGGGEVPHGGDEEPVHGHKPKPGDKANPPLAERSVWTSGATSRKLGARAIEGGSIREEGNTKGVEIGPAGGDFQYKGFSIAFPPGAVQKSTKFEFELSLDRNLWPRDYVAVAPQLICRPSVKFSDRVRITAPIWCSTSSKKVVLYVRHDTRQTSENIAEFSLALCDRKVVFHCKEFCSFGAFINEVVVPDVDFYVHMDLYYDLQANFKLVIVVDDEAAQERCRHQMERKRFICSPADSTRTRLSLGNLIVSTLICAQLPYEDAKSLVLNEEFSRALEAFLSHKITPIPDPGDELCLRSVPFVGDVCISDSEFNIRWDPPPGMPLIIDRSTNISGAIIGHITVGAEAQG